MSTARARWRGPKVLIVLFGLVAAVSSIGMYLGAQTLEREATERSLLLIPVEALRVTEGALQRRDAYAATVTTPTLRAETNAVNPAVATLDFTYLGSIATSARTGPGDGTRQIGLELRAANSCNAVSVMWRLDPAHEIEVVLYSNPGVTRSSDCTEAGRRHVLAPSKPPAPLPPLYPGERHVLRARIVADELYVQVDGVLAWAGTLPDAARQLNGVTAVRVDNVQAHFRVSAAASP